ncbi:KxYKxGKxW signal peptide domain-containing protein [Ligilactobacillus murinus]|uniref:MucBP domain-containing protein n=1 Tax=Ligilactobacillus murinus TaxID=1622 RepID=UPI001C8C11D0|nr:MucBP domain-containing protein [Ligilactobacillus murinus]MBX9013365.1 KxYKxGKxW signal peptide domain-containing protein [Ligilactobacillus murinus]
MKRYKYDQLRKAQQEKLYYKMYKAGKNWIVMGLTVVGMGILFPSLAKADDQEETLNTEVVQEDPPSDQKQGMDNTENELRQLGPEEVIETDKQVQNSTSVVAEQANENTSEVLADNEQVVSTDLSADAQVETVSQETPQIEQSTPRSAFRSVDMRAAQEKSEVPNARTEQELKKYLESSNGLMAKNSLTTPILPNPTTSSATTEDTFDEDMLSRAPRPIKSEWRSLSHYAVYYPFVKKLQAAYQAKDFKEVMNNIALINAFKKRSRAEYKIGFKEADNYTADIALRDSERSAAVIISMDQDGHIITESRTRDNKPFYGYVTGSGTVYKLTDDKEYYQGSFSEQNGTASAKVEYQVGKNGAQDYNDYNGNIADKINNRPEAKLGQYDYVGTDYYYANAAHDLIKYNDNDPKKDKFAVTKMDDLANATPNDYTITLVVNHYRKANTTVEEAQTTITYKDDSGANVTPKTQVRVAGSVGSNVAIPAAPEVSGYTLKEIKFNGAVKHTGDKVTLDKSNTLEYVYKKVAEIATIDISYKAGTQELQPARPVILSGEVGSSVAIPVAPEISEYKLKEIKFNGVTKDADTQVTLDKTNKLEYIYDKNAVSAQVTISYRAGDKVLVPTKQVNLSGKVGDIVVIPAAPVIANYHFVGATIDGERIDPGMNTVLAATNELIYKYAEDAKLAHTTVMYKDTKGNVLNVSEPVSLTGNVGANVNLPAALTISGYTLDSIVFNQVPRRVGNTVSLAAENTLEYIYLKDPVVANITVSYRAGENVLTPTNEVKFSGNIDEEVRVPLAPDVRGYQFKKATFNGKEILPNASVTLAESNTLIYNYERLRIPAKVTFEYVNEAGQTVKPIGAATLIGKIGDTVKLGNAPLLLKHQLKEIRFNGTVKTVGDSVTLEPENTVIYVYMAKEEKPATVTVSYKDDQGNNVAPNTQVAVRGNVGDKVNVPQAPEVSGYHIVGITFNGQNVTSGSEVTLTKQNELVYNYATDVKPAKITLSYKDDQGNAVTPNGQVTINGDTGAKLNLPEGPSVTGYTLKEVKFNGVTKAVGDEVSLAETNTVEYIYSKVVKAAQTTVSYKAGTQTLTPASPVSVTGNVGDKVNVPQAPEVSGYHVVGITFNGQNVTANSQVTLSKQNELVYNYEAKLVDEHVLQLNIIDDTTQKVLENGIVLGKGLLNEPVAKDVVDKYNAKFEELRTKGYDVRSYDELPADYTADKTLTIHVTHGTKEVAGPDRTVNVLLEYVYGNGPKQGSFAAEPYKEEHTFTSINVIDKVTGEIVETKWSLPTASPVIKTPKAEGYVADKATVKIPDITPDSKDVKLNVTYLTILPKENIKIEWGHALAAKDVIIVPEKLENLVINQTWKLVPDFKPTSLTDRLTSGIVTVTLSDGTKLDVEVEIEVAKLSESNEPKVDQVTISKDKQLDPKQVVNNLAELPDRTQLEWLKEPTALADGVLNVKYPDGSNDLVEVKVKKTAIADDATQTPKDINEAGIKATLEIKTTDQTETEMPKTTELPQTSDKIDNTAGILGIVVATLGGLLGFGTTKHKKKS